MYGPKRRESSACSTSATPFRNLSRRSHSGSILIVQPNQFTGRRRARRPPRFVQQHQREQAEHFRFRQQLGEQPPEPDRFGRQIVPREQCARTRRRSPR